MVACWVDEKGASTIAPSRVQVYPSDKLLLALVDVCPHMLQWLGLGANLRQLWQNRYAHLWSLSQKATGLNDVNGFFVMLNLGVSLTVISGRLVQKTCISLIPCPIQVEPQRITSTKDKLVQHLVPFSLFNGIPNLEKR